MSGDVVVIGGGFAGCAAAARLAGDGYTPLLLERAPRLGGRAASFRFSPTGETVDYGHHVLMRCCTASVGFLQRLGIPESVRIQPELEIPVLCDGRTSTLRSALLPGPLHLVPSLLRYHPLDVRERLAVLRAAFLLLLRHRPADERFAEWLRRHGQHSRSIERLWDPICIAALNAPAESVSLDAARKVFQDAFFRPKGADLGLFTVPLSEVFDAARQYIETGGGEVRTSAVVAALDIEDGTLVGVRLASGETIRPYAVVAAVPPVALRPLLNGYDDVLVGAETLQWSPIVNLHLWFDRPVMDSAFAMVVDSPLQAVFDVTESHGRVPGETGLRHLVVSQSAAQAWINRPPAAIAEELLRALAQALPALRDATCAHQLVIKHPAATFVPSPESALLRPHAKTRLRGLYLAGDWTATEWPSTIEGAVRSGIAAAARCQEMLTPG